LETNKTTTSFNEIKGFLSLQLELRFELGFRLRLTNNKIYICFSFSSSDKAFFSSKDTKSLYNVDNTKTGKVCFN
jgi:hypothetical protein